MVDLLLYILLLLLVVYTVFTMRNNLVFYCRRDWIYRGRSSVCLKVTYNHMLFKDIGCWSQSAFNRKYLDASN